MTNKEAPIFEIGDAITFQIVGVIPETGKYFLSQMRDRLYLGVVIFDVNGKPLPTPFEREIGFYVDELPPTIVVTRDHEGLDFTGIDTDKRLSATLSEGMPRFGALPGMSLFIDPKTLATLAMEALPEFQQAAAPLPPPPKKQRGFWRRLGLGF